MEFEIRNSGVSVRVSEKASEITSFRDEATGIEYMWQGDPAFWSGRNPTLFPMVGSTYDKKIRINGKVYEMGNHGFTRHSMFTCIAHTEDTIVNQLRDSEETLAQYPFHFCMTIRYTLKNRTLCVDYTLENTGTETMPFHFGLHPAFNCPLEDTKPQSAYCLELNETDLVEGVMSSRIELDREKLERTIIIDHPKTTVTRLTDGTHGVEVEAHGYDWLAFWSAKNAPFVCIEPWMSHTDFEPVECDYAEREGAILLPAGDTWHKSYTITIF